MKKEVIKMINIKIKDYEIIHIIDSLNLYIEYLEMMEKYHKDNYYTREKLEVEEILKRLQN